MINNLKNLFYLLVFLTSCSIAQKRPIDYIGINHYKNNIKPPNYKFKKQSNHSIQIGYINSHHPSLKDNQIISKINNGLSSFEKGTYLDVVFLNQETNPNNLEDFKRRDYYKIMFSNDSIKLFVYTEAGMQFALAAIDYETSISRTLKTAVIESWPDIDQRGVQINLKGMNPLVIEKVMLRVLRGHFNYVLFSMHNSVQLEAIKIYTKEYAMLKADFKDLVKLYRSYQIETIPHFSFLSHQKKHLITEDRNGTLLYNAQTVNPYSKAAQTIITSTIDEVIDLIQPVAIHIGHDEVAGHNQKQQEEYGPILDPQAFLYSVRNIHYYIKSKNLSTWMWGDMLLYAPDFPEMHKGSLNGPKSYKYLIDSIPKDIYIGDWHYKHYKGRLKTKLDFSSVDYFLSKGFKIFGASYDQSEFTKQFAEYCYDKKDLNFSNMLATTWHKLLKGTSKKDTGDYLRDFDQILEKSGNYFWNASDN